MHHYVFTVFALSVRHIRGTHLTYEKLLRRIAPDVIGATSMIGKFRLPLHGWPRRPGGRGGRAVTG